MSAPHSDNVDKGKLLVRQSDADRNLVSYSDPIQNNNPFAGKSLYNSAIDNALFFADTRWIVSGEIQKVTDGTSIRPLTDAQRAVLFSGTYGPGIGVEPGEQLDMHVKFNEAGTQQYPGGYPYGYFYLTFYSTQSTTDLTLRVYCNHAGQGVGWKTLELEDVGKASASMKVYRFRNSWHGISDIHLQIRCAAGAGRVEPNSFEHMNERPSSVEVEFPYVSKLSDQRIYRRFTWRDKSKNDNAFIDEHGSSYFKSITSPSLDAKLDKPTTGTPSATTYPNGAGGWSTPANTTYPVLTQAVADTGTATTAQSISALVLKTTIGKLTAALKAEILGGVGPAFDTLAELKTAYEGADTSLTTLIGNKLDKAPAGTAATAYLNGAGGYTTPPNATYSGMQATEAAAGSSLMDRIISPAILKGVIWNWVTGSSTTAVSAIGQALNKAATALEARTAIGAEQEGWVGTTAAYNNLGTKDANRNYYLTD